MANRGRRNPKGLIKGVWRSIPERTRARILFARDWGSCRNPIVLGADRMTDRRLGVETAELRADADRPRGGTRFGDETPYGPTPYADLRTLEPMLELGPDDIVMDVGCGRGRSEPRTFRCVASSEDP